MTHFTLRAGTPDDLSILSDIDTDAGILFERSGLNLDLPEDHEFFVAERNRWSDSLAAGATVVAIERSGTPIAFVAAGKRDGEPFVEQLSVRSGYMRMGVGSALLAATEEMARTRGASRLWLTTYGHLPFNRPFYERHAFALAPRKSWGAEIQQTIDFERNWLPLPDQRVVMRKDLADGVPLVTSADTGGRR